MDKIDNNIKIMAIIPARSGSKGIPNKNIMSIYGKPMMAYSIEQALESRYISRVIVSTDSKEYGIIAERYGAEVPFIRPSEYALDETPDLPVFLHAIEWLEREEKYFPEIIVHLRPTHPIREVGDIDNMIKILIDNPDIDSVRSVTESPYTPYKMWFIDENNILSPVIDAKIKDAYNMPRQTLPNTFMQTGSIDVMRTKTIKEKKSMTGDKVYGYLTKGIYDIDNIADLESALSNNKIILENKSFCFDIDGIIAVLTPDNDYDLATPIYENIKLVNKLFDKHNEIILFTARGSRTGINWEKKTREQLKKWGVKYNKLIFGKPACDYYIDDQSLSIWILQKGLHEEQTQ